MNKFILGLLALCIIVVSQEQPASSSEDQFASMRRTACLILSRYHSNTQKNTIEQVVQGLTPQMQQKYINKIYATAVQTCEPLINQSEVQQLFVQNADFDPTHLFHLFQTVNYGSIAQKLSQPLTSNQQYIVKFMKQFDEQMAVRREQKQATEKSQGNNQQNDIKILGMSFSKMSGFTKFVYVGIFVSIIGAFLYYGFSKLDDKKQKKTKKKKSPKKE